MEVEKLADGRYRVGKATFDTAEDALAFMGGQKAGPAPVDRSANVPWWWWAVLLPAGLFAVLVGVSALVPESPADKEKAHKRGAIKQCWEQQARKSFAPDVARFVASACEKMEADFERQFGVKP